MSLKPKERPMKELFNLTDKETKAFCRTNAWTIPPKTCDYCDTLNPSGNVICYKCQEQF